MDNDTCAKNLAGWTGNSGGWKTVEFELDAEEFAGRDVAPQLFFASDAHVEVKD